MTDGAGVLPEIHDFAENVLMYDEMAKTFMQNDQYIYGEFAQVFESSVQKSKDLISMERRAYKNPSS